MIAPGASPPCWARLRRLTSSNIRGAPRRAIDAQPASTEALVPTHALNPIDLFDIRAALTDEERLVQDSVARLVDEAVLPIIRKHFEDHTFPHELVGEIAALGLLGSSLEGYGCAGLNAVSYGLICQELERGDSGCAVSFPCSRRCACTRSTPMAAKSSGRNTCRAWRAAKSSAASA